MASDQRPNVTLHLLGFVPLCELPSQVQLSSYCLVNKPLASVKRIHLPRKGMGALDHDGSGLLCYVALTLQLMDLIFCDFSTWCIPPVVYVAHIR